MYVYLLICVAEVPSVGEPLPVVSTLIRFIKDYQSFGC